MVNAITNADKILQEVLSDSALIKNMGYNPNDYCRMSEALVCDIPVIRAIAMIIDGCVENKSERTMYNTISDYLKQSL